MQFSRSVTVHLREPSTVDAYGNEVLGATTTAVWPAEYQQRSTSELLEDRNTVVRGWLVMLPSDAAVDAIAQLDLDVGRCEVVGAPELVHHPWSGAPDHWELTARKVDG